MTSRIALSKLKAVKSRSFETHCFTAVLYFDGKAIANVSNSGNGGPNNFSPLPGCAAILKECEAWAKTLPPEVTENFTLPMDLEFAVGIMAGDEIDRINLRKEFDKCANKGGVIKNGGIYTYHVNFKAMSEEQKSKAVDQLKKQNPADAILLIDGDAEENFKKFCEIVK